MKFAWLCFFIFSAWPLSGWAKEPETAISFSELPKLIQEKNENLKAARANAEAQQERTGHLARSFLPQISAQVGEEDFRTGSDPSKSQTFWRIGTSLNLYRGGRDGLDEDIRNAQLSVAKNEVVREFRDELRGAQIAFWDLVAIEKFIVFRKEELNRNDENLRSARRRSGAGVATNADAVQFELHQLTLEQEIKQLELKKDFSQNRLAVSLGLDEHENLIVKGDFPKIVSADLPAFSVQDQLDVKSLRAREKIEALRVNQASRWWHPKVDVYANYGLPSLSDDYERAQRKSQELAAGVRLSLDFGQSYNDVSEARAKRLEAKSNSYRAVHKAREALAADHELRHDIRLTGELILANEKSIEKARNFLRLTQAEYSRGLKNGPDLLGAFRQFYELQERSVQLNRDLLTSRTELEGLLVKEGGI